MSAACRKASGEDTADPSAMPNFIRDLLRRRPSSAAHGRDHLGSPGAGAGDAPLGAPGRRELLKTVELEVCVFQSREVTVYQSALDSKVAPGPLKLAQRGQIASRGPPTGPGGFDWVRKQNGTQDRLERLAAFMNTAQALASGGYVLGSEPSQALTLAPMLDGTRIHRAAEAPEDAPGLVVGSVVGLVGLFMRRCSNISPPTRACQASSAVPKVVYDQDGLTVLDAAVKVSKEGRKAVAVNAASAYSVGGGVMSGGRHALEDTGIAESCCITSTLLASLQKAQWDQLQTPEEPRPDERGHWHEAEAFHAHVPVDGCILSPFVEVFREGSNDGYGFLASPVKLQGVCSVAMFNMNPRVSDSPLDAPRDFKTYCHQVKLKFRSVATAALEMGAEVLVCPDVGCGVFGNDPQVLGTMLGQVLREPKLAKLEVLLTGQVAFAEAVKLAATGAQVDLAPAPAAYFAQVYGKQSPAKARGGYRAPQEPMIVATVVKPVDATRGASGAPAGATHAAVGGGSGVTAGAPAQVAPAGPSGRASPGVAVPTAAPVAPTPGAASPVAAAAAAPAAAAAAPAAAAVAPAAAAAAPAASPTVTVAPAASTAPTAGVGLACYCHYASHGDGGPPCGMSKELLPVTAKGRSCALTLKAALEDTQLRPEVVHLVGCGDAERSMDWQVLSDALPSKARVVLVGPHGLGAAAAPKEELLGPYSCCDLEVCVFPHTYQRFMIQDGAIRGSKEEPQEGC
eukprot:g26070.t1